MKLCVEHRRRIMTATIPWRLAVPVVVLARWFLSLRLTFMTNHLYQLLIQ
jgi:hypothetical protein